jgi:hypothetical protein
MAQRLVMTYATPSEVMITPEVLKSVGFQYGLTINRDSDEKVWSIQVANNTYLEYKVETVYNVSTRQHEEEATFTLVNEFGTLGAEFWNQPKSLYDLQKLYSVLTGDELKVIEQ